MPIDYEASAPWPPPIARVADRYYREWLAWWSGDTQMLHEVYQAYAPALAPHVRPSQFQGGAVGWAARKWWGNPPNGPQRRLHIPAASDVSTISAGLLYADPPSMTLDTKEVGAQDALNEMIEDSMLISVLREGAEKGSAAGGVLYRLSINLDISPVPVAEALLPDNVIPEWYGPHLQAATLWTALTDNGPILRHLERHEMINKKCWVSHALFEGSPEHLGRRVPLTDGNAETRRLAGLVNEQGMIEVGTTKLDVVYVPNIRPHRLIRDTQLGRSDYSGAEGAMDGLDETWSSWMRDIRVGKGRVIVPREYLRRPGGAGSGAAWDPEQEVFAEINAGAPGGDAPPALTVVQFAIRVQEHRDTVAAHWRTITSNAGLDTSDHDTENGPTQTATQVNDKSSRKRGTRGAKISYQTPALQQILWVMQELANMAPAKAKIEWPDQSAPDMQTLAQTLQLIAAANAASTQTLVEMLHPDWDETAVAEEVERIQKASAPPEDPGTFTGAPAPAPDPLIEDDGAGLPPVG